MRERKDITNYGRDLSSRQLWDNYVRETNRMVSFCIPSSQLRIALNMDEEVAPGK